MQFPQAKEVDAYQGTKTIQNIKQNGPGKKFLMAHDNQNTVCVEQGKNTKIYEGKRENSIYSKTSQNNI